MVEQNEPALLTPTDIRALAEKLLVVPTKKLGQNFVHDGGTVRKIARLAGIHEGETVLEVGPGLGSLTLALLEAKTHVTAVEIDPVLASALMGTVKGKSPDAAKRLTVIEKDALKISAADISGDPNALPTAFVANLPYNVAVPILLHVLQELPTITRVLIMVQKEVAERLVAGPGSRVYGTPSVKVAWYGTAKQVGIVKPSVFWPKPNVDSALVQIEVDAERDQGDEFRKGLFALVDAAFGERRKMLRTSLKRALVNLDLVKQTLEGAGINGDRRAETLDVEEYLRLTRSALDLGWQI